MKELPEAIRPVLRRLARRLAVGQFLDVWPRWAVASLLVAGLAALVCRMFVPRAAGLLPWLWLAPVLASLPAAVVCLKRAYRPAEISALADSLSGGRGTLLALAETGDTAWAHAAAESLSRLALPRLRPWRRLWPVLPAMLFLAAALLIEQRTMRPGNAVLANDIAAELKTTLAELKKQELITKEEERKLEEEIERIRKGAMERVDPSSWEASDTLREKVVAGLSEKQDAVKWAGESLARYAAAAQAGTPNSPAQAGELAKAIENLAKTGLLNDASAELQQLLGGQYAVAGGKVQLPTDPAALRRLSELLSADLAKRGQRFADLAKLGKAFGRFDPSEYPLFNNEPGPDGDGDPGVGGINRGRGDAPLTWGKESLPFDRFKPVALPPGSVRSPDEWSPVAVLPGAPKESPEASAPAAAQSYAGAAGQGAWRRTLAPRHHSAVKKYFDNSGSN